MTRDGADDFRDFYDAVAPHVLRQVFALTGDREEARDVAQEAFARAWLKWGRLTGHGDP
ncbi:MAG: hypothetical protein QOC60_197, partial [Frankiaceae bacterium]|nr:hypothetical protein [Frankiaceae bacterium]